MSSVTYLWWRAETVGSPSQEVDMEQQESKVARILFLLCNKLKT